MVLINKSQFNQLVLNINNNSSKVFITYQLVFTHTLSQEVKTYTINLNNSSQYGQNDRYCVVILDLNSNDLPYEGQYDLKIYGNGLDLVYTGLVMVTATQTEVTFVEYESDNEVGENYIYIED